MLSNRIPPFRISPLIRNRLFSGLMIWLLLVSLPPAIDAFFHPQSYIYSQDRLIHDYNQIQPGVGSRYITQLYRAGVRLEALVKLTGCGFVLVLMWKGIHRTPMRPLILVIGFLTAAADPPLGSLLEHTFRVNTLLALRAAETLHPFAAAALVRFALVFPRSLDTSLLVGSLSGPHSGLVRRACRRATAARPLRRMVARLAPLVSVIGSGLAYMLSRVPFAIR